MQLAAEKEKEKALQLLGGILLKLQAFCEKTRNALKELKDGVPTAVDVFKKGEGGLWTSAGRPGLKGLCERGRSGCDRACHGGGPPCVQVHRHEQAALVADTFDSPALG